MAKFEMEDVEAGLVFSCIAVIGTFAIVSVFGTFSSAVTNDLGGVGHWVATSFGLLPWCGWTFLSIRAREIWRLSVCLLLDIGTGLLIWFFSPFVGTLLGGLLFIPAFMALIICFVMHAVFLWQVL